MKTKIGKLDVSLVPMNPDRMIARQRAAINARRQIITQKYDCATLRRDPTPPKKSGWVRTLVCGHPVRTFNGAAYKRRQAEIEATFFKAAGLKQTHKGYADKLATQFFKKKFQIPYDALLKQHAGQTIEIDTEAHYHLFNVITPALKKGETLTLMMPFKVTHTVFVYGYCLSTGYSETPYDPEKHLDATQKFAPRTKDAIRAKAAWRKARLKELEQEVAQREKAMEFMKKWLEKVRSATEGD
ncbi:MAG: hypothetical protein AAFN59_04455 [Pseudomonadota bacterium]